MTDVIRNATPRTTNRCSISFHLLIGYILFLLQFPIPLLSYAEESPVSAATPPTPPAVAEVQQPATEVNIPPTAVVEIQPTTVIDVAPVTVVEAPVERIFWDRMPIKLTLRVGVERIVQFSGTTLVQVGVPGKLTRGLLRTQIVDNTVYWLANDAFKSERIQIINAGTGETFLFDLEAQKDAGGTARVEVISAIQKEKERSAKLKKERSQAVKGQAYDYISLTRFAASQMYAPLRLAGELPGMVAIPLEPDKKIFLVRGGKVEATPLMIWKSPNWYVSAVRLKNATSEYVTLDPRSLRGDWLAATFQHVRLMPAGDEADTTCVYLISKHNPFPS